MSAFDDGGPAYPHDKYQKNAEGGWGTYAHGGMSLRDAMAISVLPALLAKLYADAIASGIRYETPVYGVAAEGAYEAADAMLVARRDPLANPPPKWVNHGSVPRQFIADGHYRVIVSGGDAGSGRSGRAVKGTDHRLFSLNDYETWAHVKDGIFVGAQDEEDQDIVAYFGPIEIPERPK